MYASRKNYVEIARELIKAGAEVNRQNRVRVREVRDVQSDTIDMSINLI